MDPATLAMWESWRRRGRNAVMPFVERRNFEADRALERTQAEEDRNLKEQVDRARIEAITDRNQVERERQAAVKSQQEAEWQRQDAEFKRKSEDWNRVFDLNQATLDKSQAHALKLKEKFASELEANALRAAKASLTPEQAKKMAELREKWDDPEFKDRMAQLASANPGFDPNNPDPNTLFREASIDKEKYQAAYEAYYTSLSAQRETNQAQLHDASAWPENLVFAERNVAVQKQALAGLYRQAGQQDPRYIAGRPMLDVVQAVPTLDEQAAVDKVAQDEAAGMMSRSELDRITPPVDPSLVDALQNPEKPPAAASLAGVTHAVTGKTPGQHMGGAISDAGDIIKGVKSLPDVVSPFLTGKFDPTDPYAWMESGHLDSLNRFQKGAAAAGRQISRIPNAFTMGASAIPRLLHRGAERLADDLWGVPPSYNPDAPLPSLDFSQ